MTPNFSLLSDVVAPTLSSSDDALTALPSPEEQAQHWQGTLMLDFFLRQGTTSMILDSNKKNLMMPHLLCLLERARADIARYVDIIFCVHNSLSFEERKWWEGQRKRDRVQGAEGGKEGQRSLHPDSYSHVQVYTNSFFCAHMQAGPRRRPHSRARTCCPRLFKLCGLMTY